MSEARIAVRATPTVKWSLPADIDADVASGRIGVVGICHALLAAWELSGCAASVAGDLPD